MGKKLAIIGLSAGLLGGGAAGLAFTGTTGIAGAQDATSTTVAADTPADASTGTADADRPDPSTKLAEALAPLVTDGTLTQAQADKVVETLKAAGPMGGGHGPGRDGGGRGRGGGPGAEAAATALGMTADELRTELQGGTTIAELATEKGVELSTVTDAMLAAEQAHLAEEVTAGKITQAQADERLSGAADRITARVNGEKPERPADAPADAPADHPPTVRGRSSAPAPRHLPTTTVPTRREGRARNDQRPAHRTAARDPPDQRDAHLRRGTDCAGDHGSDRGSAAAGSDPGGRRCWDEPVRTSTPAGATVGAGPRTDGTGGRRVLATSVAQHGARRRRQRRCGSAVGHRRQPARRRPRRTPGRAFRPVPGQRYPAGFPATFERSVRRRRRLGCRSGWPGRHGPARHGPRRPEPARHGPGRFRPEHL